MTSTMTTLYSAVIGQRHRWLASQNRLIPRTSKMRATMPIGSPTAGPAPAAAPSIGVRIGSTT